jgi:hypothetical protein
MQYNTSQNALAPKTLPAQRWWGSKKPNQEALAARQQQHL